VCVTLPTAALLLNARANVLRKRRDVKSAANSKERIKQTATFAMRSVFARWHPRVIRFLIPPTTFDHLNAPTPLYNLTSLSLAADSTI